MIIDLILDRREDEICGDNAHYNDRRFYMDVMHYSSPSADAITYAMDYLEESDVKKALCDYIVKNNYSRDICDYIMSVDWLIA